MPTLPNLSTMKDVVVAPEPVDDATTNCGLVPPKTATESLAYGDDVPMPRLPVERMVILAESEGPIMVELMVEFKIEVPKADAPDAETVFRYPKADDLEPDAKLPFPMADAWSELAVFAAPIADP